MIFQWGAAAHDFLLVSTGGDFERLLEILRQPPRLPNRFVYRALNPLAGTAIGIGSYGVSVPDFPLYSADRVCV